MARFGKGDEVGKWTYRYKGWKVSVLSIKQGYTQANPDDGGPSLFFDSEEQAREHIDKNTK